MGKAVQFDELLSELEKDPEFRNARRRIKPYFDLLKDILRRRKKLGITQKELAKRANTHQSRISKIESGEHDIRLSTVISIAEALDTEVIIQLLPYEEEKFYGKGENIFRTNLIDPLGQDLDEYSEEEINSYFVRAEYE
jgi:transcriptional regulator with XRE-family HTH domain